MKTTKTFKAGSPLSDVIHFAMVEPSNVGGVSHTRPGSRATTLDQSLRVTVELVAARKFDPSPVLVEFGLESVAGAVDEFLEYKRDELRKAVRSIKSLRRLLKPFDGKPADLESAIVESMRHGWTGIFDKSSSQGGGSRAIGRKGGSNGGEW